MTPGIETIESVGIDLAEARAKIELTLQALQAVPQDAPEIRQAIARLERMEAELVRIEGVVASREGLG